MSKKKSPEEYPEHIKLYDHVPNSGVVHMPGRRFPGITLQGDSMCSLLSVALSFMQKAKQYRDEEMYYDAREFAQLLRLHLLHYEQTLEEEGFDKPYTMDVKGLDLEKKFEDS